MSYILIANNTWVLNDGKKTIQNHYAALGKKAESQNQNFNKIKRNRRPQEQNEVYKDFCKEVFKERKFIGRREFNEIICERFNSNTSFYRRRMIDLNLISEKFNLIKPI